jgi:tight adherence protein B
MTVVIAILFAVSITGLAYTFLRAFYSGAEIYAGTYSQETARQFEDIFLFIPPRRIAETGWALAAVTFILLFFLAGSLTTITGVLVGSGAGGLGGLLAFHLPHWLLSLLKTRRLRRFNGQLADTLVSMSNALKAGFSIAQSFESVVREGENPIAQEFDVLLQETRVGVAFSDALANMSRRVGSDDLTLVVAAIEASRRAGGNLTEIFDKISETIRERLRIENRIHTLTAQGRLQGIVVGAMPAVILAALLFVDPELMLPFLHSKIGLIALGLAAVLIALGGFFIRKIIRIDV